MADTKVSALTAQTDLATTDVFYMVDDPGGTAASKKIEAQYVSPVGKQTMWIPAAAMIATASNGCSNLNLVETTAGRPDMQVLDFDSVADEHAQFQVAFSNSWNLGTVTAQFFWTHAGGQTAGLDGVAFGIQGVAVSDDDTIDVAYGTAVVMTAKDGATAEDLYVSAETSAITIAGTPVDGDVCYFRVFRDVSDAGDDLDIDARLVGVKLYYTLDKARDD
jgi:hypothetical protein